MRGRLSVVTVGCKANFADSAAILAHAARAGFEVVAGGEPADVLVVNSCTVTRRADRDSRALARRLRREHPGALLVMTGCFAETTTEARESVPEVDHWLGIREPSALPRLLRSLAGDVPPPDEELSDVAADRLLGHSRVFLKVQDGCDAACAYCVVPKARGPCRSLPRREVVERAVRAERDGAREIVLTGIHAGRFGAERGEPDGLAGLVEALLGATSGAGSAWARSNPGRSHRRSFPFSPRKVGSARTCTFRCRAAPTGCCCGCGAHIRRCSIVRDWFCSPARSRGFVWGPT